MQSGRAQALRRQSSPAGPRHLESSAVWCQVCWDAPESSLRGSVIIAQRLQIAPAHQNPQMSAAVPLLLDEASQALAADAPSTEIKIIA